MERGEWEQFKEDVEMWLGLAMCAAVFGFAYSFGKKLCDQFFGR